MAAERVFVFLVFYVIVLMVPYNSSAQNSSSRKSFIIRVEDYKDFKKLLRTKTNLLVICAQSEKATAKVMKLFEEVAEEMKGKATLGYINCGDDKKLCKKLKFSPTEFNLNHYKDGEFNKDYDRKMTFKSMVNFLMDPTGDLPWEEDPTATDVIHISTEDVCAEVTLKSNSDNETPATGGTRMVRTGNSFHKMLKKEKNPILVMFYAPWCGYCKQLKPHFSEAATELKDRAALVGLDVDKPPMMSLRLQYNITGFPTLLYYEKGKLMYKYGGENTKAGIISWLQDPRPPTEKEKEQEWADEDSEVVHLTDATFNEFVKQNPSVLVMFYAPWCGHCKKMKPGYTDAAQILKEQGVVGVLAAVDATKEKKIGQEHGVKGFPTVKYFKNGEFAFEVSERDKDKIVEFMKDPKEPPPPPTPESRWEEVESEVIHLTDDTFKSFLKKKKHCLIMFYAPWCGHCKKAKPEFMNAAEKFKSDPKVAFSAVDCTVHMGTCKLNDVTGYPTFKYFNYGKNSQKYMGGREENDFVAFMNDPLNPAPSPKQTSPPAESMEDQWKAYPGFQHVKFLNNDGFQQTVADYIQVLVMFYAPWCGHCQKMKPDFAAAAEIVSNNWLGLLAAVDATQERDLADKFDVKGYPTLIFFTGDNVTEYRSGRSTDELVLYMHKALYSDEADQMPAQPFLKTKDNNSNHFLTSRSIKVLSKNNFTQVLGGNDKAGLVMFYKPGCSYCQSASPHFLKAAKTTEATNRLYAAVDCSQEEELCEMENVKTFPSFKLFVGGRFLAEYSQSPNFINLRNFLESAPLQNVVDEKTDQKVDVKIVSGVQQEEIKKKFKEDL